MLTFKNIKKGRLVQIDHKEFDSNLLIVSEQFEKIFDINSSNEFKLIDKLELNNNFYAILEHNPTKLVIRCMLTNLKNSGIKDNQSKRIQVISKTPFFKENEPFFIIGLYNTGDKIILNIAEISKFVINAIKGKSYSSFWVPLDLLIETYRSKKENVILEKRGGYFINSITMSKLIKDYRNKLFEVLVYNEKILNLLKDINGQRTPTITPPVDPPLIIGILPPGVTTTTVTKLNRDQQLRIKTLKRANYKCEICKKTNTFLDSSKKMYFEAHHIIPFHQEAQKKFKYSLDHESNLVCLCPECHRKIHHSGKDSINEMLTSLLLKRKDLIERYELFDRQRIESIMDFYLTSEGKEDE